jgi:hypothetical protein
MQKEFKKGEYIVPLMDDSPNNNWNHKVLKQRENSIYVRPEVDPNTKSTTATWLASNYSKSRDWRYATPEERSLYNMENGPCKAKEVSVDTSNSYYEIY